jgi:AcrR family transcriptional regulator
MSSAESRQRILESMIVAVGRKGYRAATVGDVIAEAGASRATFYKHFDDKHDCFLAAYKLVSERVLAAVEAGCDAERPWLERVRAGLASLVELLGADPGLARVAVVEAVVAGAEARRRQLAAIEHFAQILEAGRTEEGRGDADDDGAFDGQLPANTGLMAASAVAGLLFDEIQAGLTAELPQRLPDLLFALLVPYLGPREAEHEIRTRRSPLQAKI